MFSFIYHLKNTLEIKVSKDLDLGKTQNNVTIKTDFFFTYLQHFNKFMHGKHHQHVTKSHITFNLAVLKFDMKIISHLGSLHAETFIPGVRRERHSDSGPLVESI